MLDSLKKFISDDEANAEIEEIDEVEIDDESDDDLTDEVAKIKKIPGFGSFSVSDAQKIMESIENFNIAALCFRFGSRLVFSCWPQLLVGLIVVIVLFYLSIWLGILGLIAYLVYIPVVLIRRLLQILKIFDPDAPGSIKDVISEFF